MLIPIEISILEVAAASLRSGDGWLHGYALAKAMADASGAGKLTSHGTLYKALGRMADFLREKTAIEPQMAIREGNRSEEIVGLIEEDEDIAIMVLAAGTDKEGPGPLVTALAGKGSGAFPVPITIVPGHLDEAAIADIT